MKQKLLSSVMWRATLLVAMLFGALGGAQAQDGEKLEPKFNLGETFDIAKNASYTLTTGTDVDCDVQTDGEVTIASANNVRLAIEGLTMTASNVSQAVRITVTAAEGPTYKAGTWTCDVQIKNPLTINLKSKTFYKGNTYQFTIGNNYKNNIQTDGEVSLTSSDENIVTVDGTAITGVGTGTAIITVKSTATSSYAAGQGEITVTVNEKLDPVFKSSTIKDQDIYIGSNLTLTKGTKTSNDIKTDGNVSLTSSDPNVATIDGLTITPIATGRATITVAAEEGTEYKADSKAFEVTVKEKLTPVFPASKTCTWGAINTSGSYSYSTDLSMRLSTTANSYNIKTDGTISNVTSSNEYVAIVENTSSQLYITPLAVGTTTLHIETTAGKTYKAGIADITLTINPYQVPYNAKKYSTIAELDFTSPDWGFPSSSASSPSNIGTENAEFTNGTYTIKISDCSNGGYYQFISPYALNFYNHLQIGKKGATLTLPAINEEIEAIKINAVGLNKYVNIYKGETPVSTQKSFPNSFQSAGSEIVFEINEDYQAPNTQYSLKVETDNATINIRNIFLCKKDNTVAATLNTEGYSTLCSEYSLDFSDYESADYSAWQVTGISGDNIIFEQVTGQVTGGTGLLLMGSPESTVNVTTIIKNQTTLPNNELVGTYVPTYVGEGEYYGLSGNEFVKVSEGIVPAGKALLPASLIDETTVKNMNFVFTDETGIMETRTVNANQAAEIFNLAGQRLQKAQKGVNIVNGKKVLVK